MRVARATWVVLAVCLLSCGKGTTAPSGTDLAGRWRTDEHKYSSSGTSVRVFFEFTVSPDSSTVTSLRMLSVDSPTSYVALVGPFDDGFLAENVPRTVPISGGSFEMKRDNPNVTCNGTKLSLRFRGNFRSATEADGDWKDTNLGPAGYDFCGTESFDWKATKR